jgi:hypothetical protein
MSYSKNKMISPARWGKASACEARLTRVLQTQKKNPWWLQVHLEVSDILVTEHLLYPHLARPITAIHTGKKGARWLAMRWRYNKGLFGSLHPPQPGRPDAVRPCLVACGSRQARLYACRKQPPTRGTPDSAVFSGPGCVGAPIWSINDVLVYD